MATVELGTAGGLLALLAMGAGLATADTLVSEGVAGWRLDSPLTATAGSVLWLVDDAGSWRVEIAVDAERQSDEEDLLTRRGQGYTLTCAAPAAVLWQPWGEPWQDTDAALGPTVADLLARWGGTGDPEPVTRPWRAVGGRARRAEVLTIERLPAAWSVADPQASAQDRRSELRRALAARGRGRGGPGLRLEVSTTASLGLELTSTRWPVTLHLDPAVVHRRSDVPAEAFVPIWSLADLGMFPVEP